MPKQTIEMYLRQEFTQSTAKGYLYTINHFLKIHPRAKRYKHQDIVDYMEEVGRKAKPQYSVRILSAIKKYYDFLVLNNYRSDHPCKKLNVKVRYNQDIQVQDLFSSEELQLLLSRENRYQHLDTRNNIIVSLLIYQGLSCAEIAGLELKDVKLDAGTIYIKGSAYLDSRTLELVSKQMILFHQYINEIRPQLLRCQTEKLIITKLGKPITTDSIHAMIEQLKSLFPDRNLNPKTIRMSVICNWLNERKYKLEKVQELAGHKWPGTTEKYIKVDAVDKREQINRFFPL